MDVDEHVRPDRLGAGAPGGAWCDRREFPVTAAPGETLPAEPGDAVWLLPTPEVRRAAFTSRGSQWQSVCKTSDLQEPFATCANMTGYSPDSADRNRKRPPACHRDWHLSLIHI